MTHQEWLEKDPGLTAFDIYHGRVHNWQNYVPEDLKDGWSFLTPNERSIIYLMAKEQADSENWE